MNSSFSQILFAVSAILIIWFIVRLVKNNREGFSKANLEKSIFTFGVLALFLIAFIATLVFYLRGA